MNGQSLQKAFCALPGGATAIYNLSGIAYYRHSDWLGSSRFASTPTTRQKYFDVAYAPYGEDYVGSGTTDLDFTGQNQDAGSGLYDFLYREYHPNSSRWIQPDPAGLGVTDASSPQTWNRYAYLSNMPLSAIDYLGLGMMGRGADTVPYMQQMAHTAAFFDRFEFFSLYLLGDWNADRRWYEHLEWLGFVGSGVRMGAAANNCATPGSNGCYGPPKPQPPKPCYSGNSVRDREVRFFSLVRLGQTWGEWVLGYGAKLTWFGAAKTGAKAAGGAESMGSAALTTGVKGLGLAGTVLIVDATAADLGCMMEIDEHGLPVH
jgi:RHS repeat-associated protein